MLVPWMVFFTANEALSTGTLGVTCGVVWRFIALSISVAWLKIMIFHQLSMTRHMFL